jgi:hypothetical protein
MKNFKDLSLEIVNKLTKNLNYRQLITILS